MRDPPRPVGRIPLTQARSVKVLTHAAPVMAHGPSTLTGSRGTRVRSGLSFFSVQRNNGGEWLVQARLCGWQGATASGLPASSSSPHAHCFVDSASSSAQCLGRDRVLCPVAF